MSEIKDYGEPWYRPEGENAIFEGIGNNVKWGITQPVQDSLDRAVACVNALAGRDPAKLEGLVEAVNNVTQCSYSESLDNTYELDEETYWELRNALAAFEGGEI